MKDMETRQVILSPVYFQNDMIVSLDNGDMLKCNIQNSLKTLNPEQEPANTECPRIYRPLLIREVNLTFIYCYVNAESNAEFHFF